MTVPAGTEVVRIEHGGYAVATCDLDKVIGGNAHDLAHYYVWVPADAVA